MKISGVSRRRTYTILIIILATIFLLVPLTVGISNQSNVSSNVSNITPTIYKAEVDQDYGFYRIIDVTASKHAPYDTKNHTLTIHVGDVVIWENDATPDEPLTIISKEGLWENRSAYLRWNYQKFTYTFNKSGTYEMYIKEYPREQHQIIIVKDIVAPKETVSTTPMVINTVFPTTDKKETPIEISPKKEGRFPIEIVIAIIVLTVIVIYLYHKNREM